jgi:acetyltransferase-like isoleucine patch superfamily enzyme
VTAPTPAPKPAPWFAHPTATVEEGAVLGEGTRVWHYAQVRKGARLGKGVIVGKSAFVDVDVTVGDRCKVQNFATLYHGLTVGNDVFIGPSATFTNDRVPRAFNANWTLGKTVIEDGASIGANSTIVCDTTIGRYAMVASGAVVTRDVPAHALVMGNPARIKGFVCVCGKKLRGPGKRKGDKDAFACAECGQTVELPISLVAAHRSVLE